TALRNVTDDTASDSMDVPAAFLAAMQETAALALRAGVGIGAQDAQAEIERLRKVNAQLVEALQKITNEPVELEHGRRAALNMDRIARAALSAAGRSE
ncbi:MAG: hypothetical protein ACTS5I_13690, partial [Rhodanobacter sp.]